jgi:small GTP-binding protein
MSNKDNRICYKMVIIGDSDTGKKIILKKIPSGIFNEKFVSTIGMDRRILTFTINTEEGEREIEIQLYDTAGHERFISLTSLYYKSSQGLLFVYDITKKESFDKINNWIEDVKSYLEDENNLLIILLGNKDLALVNPDCREITSEYAENFCKENNLFWGGEYCLKDITEEQVKEMFKKFALEIYKKVGIIKEEEYFSKNKHKSKKLKCIIY